MSFGELMVVAVACLVLFGGKRLPEVMRNLGKTVRTLRRYYNEFKKEMGLDDFDDLRKK